MGHDIYGFNHAGDQIAYARFSMGNYNADFLYHVLDANQFNGGVSGLGKSATYSKHQLENAIKMYIEEYGDLESQMVTSGEDWDKKQIADFLINCYKVVEEEGSVTVYFG